jgi:hypothetical protein
MRLHAVQRAGESLYVPCDHASMPVDVLSAPLVIRVLQPTVVDLNSPIVVRLLRLARDGMGEKLRFSVLDELATAHSLVGDKAEAERIRGAAPRVFDTVEQLVTDLVQLQMRARSEPLRTVPLLKALKSRIPPHDDSIAGQIDAQVAQQQEEVNKSKQTTLVLFDDDSTIIN